MISVTYSNVLQCKHTPSNFKFHSIMPPGTGIRSCKIADWMDAFPAPFSRVTAANLAFQSLLLPNGTHHRTSILVTMPCRLPTSAALTSAAADFSALAHFSSSVKCRRFDLPSCSALTARVIVQSCQAQISLSALLEQLFILGCALG